ncbi:hypothetical protein LZ24_01450 [Desulfobotulus alkaliphilus]|uniref:Uncharacterized protein n=1 Tax=Desulfobotulus alkaliphilus TaxID=622671 RepID=A0A562RVE2_9BACT|nr:hypothetical protein [Desulfobotulus alkaliphilus]TWI73039.1 hypothetical protein LZ24_01450 [Desulfobotulus alkaliphilus]
MSEYQYYEFLSMDQPLTSRQMEELRQISTRAQITSVSFVNEYNWSDLKADPKKLMKNYFDAHVYFANWGTVFFMLKLPVESLKAEDLEAFAVHDCLEVEKFQKHWLITWSFSDDENFEYSDHIFEENWMALLAPIREELLRGDLRSLYLGWLRGIYLEDAEDGQAEPMALRGLGQLTSAQQALGDFLGLDDDLVTAAGMGLPTLEREDEDEASLQNWVETLSEKQMRQHILLMAGGEGAKAERMLKQAYRSWLVQSQPKEKALRPRPLTAILKQLEEAKQARLKKEAQIKKKKADEEKRKRDTFLEKVAGDFSKVWDSAHKEAKKGYASAYDQACQHLCNLKDAYARQNKSGEFEKKLAFFRKEHGRRRALMERLIRERIISS